MLGLKLNHVSKRGHWWLHFWCLCDSMWQHWRCSGVSLRHLSGRPEWYPAAYKRLLVIQTKTRCSICLMSCTVILNGEGNLSPLRYGARHGLLWMWPSSIDARVAPPPPPPRGKTVSWIRIRCRTFEIAPCITPVIPDVPHDPRTPHDNFNSYRPNIRLYD